MQKIVFLIICIMSLIQPVKGYCFLYSDGSDGAFYASTNMIVDLPSDGIFNFTTITIDDGVIVNFNRNADNTPVYFLATGEVIIDGIVNVSAIGTIGGPGGGNAGEDLGQIGGVSGGGDDGGSGGSLYISAGDLIINKRDSILIGGDKGGDVNCYSDGDLAVNLAGQDRGAFLTFHGGSGGTTTGGGGGALWLSTFNNNDITICGSILSNGSIEGSSGGVISLLTDSSITIGRTGFLQANGMDGGNGGSIRLEGNDIALLDGSRIETTVVPIPCAMWLFVSGLIGLLGISKTVSYT